jgi:hypothetical protein
MLARLREKWSSSGGLVGLMATADVERLEARILMLLADLWHHRTAPSRDLHAHVVDLTQQLRRARDTIAVLYAGNLARRADGTVDVDRVIEAIVGQA